MEEKGWEDLLEVKGEMRGFNKPGIRYFPPILSSRMSLLSAPQ